MWGLCQEHVGPRQEVSILCNRLSRPKDLRSPTVLEFNDYGEEEKHNHKHHNQPVNELVA